MTAMLHKTDPPPSHADTTSSCDPELVNFRAAGADTPERPGEEAGGLATPRRYWSAAIWLAIAMTVIDTSIANVALPTIARDIGASPASSIWVVNAYQIAIVMSLLPVAALGEIVT